jgi:hypothetical protein
VRRRRERDQEASEREQRERRTQPHTHIHTHTHTHTGHKGRKTFPGEYILAFHTLVKHGLAFISRSHLHGVEIHFGVLALGTLFVHLVSSMHARRRVRRRRRKKKKKKKEEERRRKKKKKEEERRRKKKKKEEEEEEERRRHIHTHHAGENKREQGECTHLSRREVSRTVTNSSSCTSHDVSTDHCTRLLLCELPLGLVVGALLCCTRNPTIGDDL